MYMTVPMRQGCGCRSVTIQHDREMQVLGHDRAFWKAIG
jgi:hypothetical protein